MDQSKPVKEAPPPGQSPQPRPENRPGGGSAAPVLPKPVDKTPAKTDLTPAPKMKLKSLINKTELTRINDTLNRIQTEFIVKPRAVAAVESTHDPGMIITTETLHDRGSDDEILPRRMSTASFKTAFDVGKSTSITTASTMSIFLNDWKRQQVADLEVIPDPVMRPELINYVSYRLNTLYAVIVFVSVVVYTAFHIVWRGFPPLFCKTCMLEIYWPEGRSFATIIDFVLVPMLIALLGGLYASVTDPREWGFGRIRLNRLTRWLIYFIILSYLIVMTVYWIKDLTLVQAKLDTRMFEAFINVVFEDDGNIITEVDETQIYFRCCGVYTGEDWILNPPAITVEPNQTDTNKNVTFFPWTCCDFKNDKCNQRPTLLTIWQDGCLKYERAMVYTVIGISIIIQISIILMAIAGFFYVYVLEILVLKVKTPEEFISEVVVATSDTDFEDMTDLIPIPSD